MSSICIIFMLVAVSPFGTAMRQTVTDFLRLPSDRHAGTRWAVLIAGSNGYWNYRHQADVCHAYQLLRKGGLREENIIVFMYDDIAFSEENPRPGIIINSPLGVDVYEGVPKDYTGEDVTVDNFFAVILANETALSGGSRKVVDSGPDDHIFIYYTDHGGPGVLGMPTNSYLYANDLIDILKKKHASRSYKRLVLYIEACESGSIFEGLLPEGLNIYATTAANSVENSYGTYCPGDYASPPPEYETCVGDLYSVAWMEDSDVHNLHAETLHQQYELVKKRTANSISAYGSHVMQYGDIGISKDKLFLYMGTNPANDNSTLVDSNGNSLRRSLPVNQRDADLIHYWDKFRKAPEGSPRKAEAQKQFVEAMSRRATMDRNMELIAKLLLGIEEASFVMNTVRPAGEPLVDDWDCLKTLVKTFERNCGSLAQYGMKHMRFLGNLCNIGIKEHQMCEASEQACLNFHSPLSTMTQAPWACCS